MAKSNGPIRAAGVVLLRKGRNGPLVCVLHRPRQKDWSLPKGKLDPGESVIEAARRETIEETGSDVTLGVRLKTQAYKVESRKKTVDYWVGFERFGGPGFRPNREVDELRWLPPAAALKKLTYPRDAELVREALAAPRTTALIILRHTEAMRRADYKGKSDAERPLTKAGEKQARALVPILDAFGVEKIFSSDYKRCMDTVRPFAQEHKLKIVREPLLSEQGFEDSPSAALRRMDQILRERQPSVVCTHRPVLPDVIKHVAARLGLKKTPDPVLAPGEALVFQVANKRCVAVEKIGP